MAGSSRSWRANPPRTWPSSRRGERGILTTAELRACGLTRREIERWLRNGHLHEKHRGVYAVGHREISVEARWLAAVKACGENAVLSHYAAAALWGLVSWDGRPVDVTTATTRRATSRASGSIGPRTSNGRSTTPSP